MNEFVRPTNDAERAAYLATLAIVDSAPDKNLDRINDLTKLIFSTDIAAVTLLSEEKQWFKCVVGLEGDGTDRGVAICNYTIMQDDIFEVTDLAAHPDLKDNPLVSGPPHLRYYAGAPINVEGFNLGSLCILGYQPRPPLTENERATLKGLAALVVREIKVQTIIRESLALISSHGEHQLPD